MTKFQEIGANFHDRKFLRPPDLCFHDSSVKVLTKTRPECKVKFFCSQKEGQRLDLRKKKTIPNQKWAQKWEHSYFAKGLCPVINNPGLRTKFQSQIQVFQDLWGLCAIKCVAKQNLNRGLNWAVFDQCQCTFVLQSNFIQDFHLLARSEVGNVFWVKTRKLVANNCQIHFWIWMLLRGKVYNCCAILLAWSC